VSSHHHHDHDHHHHHTHDHGHSHAPAQFNRAFAIGIFLNTAFVVIETVYGFFSHSLALLSDAGHNLSDVLGLLLAWGAGALLQKLPTKTRTYGLRRTTVLAALTNAVILLLAVGGIAWEAIWRFAHPQEVLSTTVIIVATIGIGVNGATAWLFHSGKKGDLNIRGAYLHMLSDALVSVGVVLAAIAITVTHWLWIDPAVSLIIALIIGIGTWSLLRESLNLALDAVPAGIKPVEVERYLSELPGIQKIHDLHIWAMSTTENALTAHLVKNDGLLDDALLSRINTDLKKIFDIHHTTIQFETGDDHFPCQQEPSEVV
jgi:cobalt-zinc-cadmium efflux system protein